MCPRRYLCLSMLAVISEGKTHFLDKTENFHLPCSSSGIKFWLKRHHHLLDWVQWNSHSQLKHILPRDDKKAKLTNINYLAILDVPREPKRTQRWTCSNPYVKRSNLCCQLLVWGWSIYGDEVTNCHNWKPSEEFHRLLSKLPLTKVRRPNLKYTM